MPGPANYERKRMFDNKQAIDYSKRFQTSMNMGYNTATVGFPAANGATNNDGLSSLGGGQVGPAGSTHNWNDCKPVIDEVIESPQRKASHRALATNASIKHANNHGAKQYSSM